MRYVISVLVGCMMLVQVAFCAEGEIPELRFEKNIGDMRGKGMDNYSVAVSEDGTIYVLMAGGGRRIAVFDSKGGYQKSLKVEKNWHPHTPYLAIIAGRVLVGTYQTDYPWVYDDQRKGETKGKFNKPSQVVADAGNNIYVADTGNKRIQIFSPDNTQTPVEVIELDAPPQSIAVRNGTLAVKTDQEIICYEKGENGFVKKASIGNRFNAPGLAVGPDGSIYAAFRQGPNRHWLKKYAVVEGQLKELSTVAPSYMDQWPNFFPANVPMTEGPDGEIWFGTAHTHWRVLSLDPRTDKVQERIQGSHPPLCVAFDAGNNAYVSGFPHRSDKGPKIYVYPQLGKGGEPKVYPAGKILYEGKAVPIWDLLPDDDGGVFVRVVEEGYRKGWPAFTIKKVYPDGKMEKFYDFGPAFAKRTKFHPSAACYGLQFDGEGHVVLASIPTVSVIKLAKNGELIWEAGQQPSGGADMVEFKAPRDTAVDSKGNIWAVDSETNKIYCLSPSGKLLFEYGGYAGVDEVEGKGFRSPSGIAIATVGEKEYLYVGDHGNQRIVKFRIAWK